MNREVRVTAVLVAAVLAVVSHVYVTIPLVPAIAGEQGTTIGAAAWTGSVFGVGFALGALVFPTVSDHVDPRRVMAAGLVVVAVADVVAGLAPDLVVLVAARAVQGFVAPALPPVALAYLPRVVPVRAVPAALAVVSSAFLLAGIVGQAWSLLLLPGLGWRWTLVAPVPLLLLLAVLVTRLPATPPPATAASVVQVVRTLGSLLRRRQVVVGYVAAVTVLTSLVGMYVALAASSAGLGATGPVSGLLLRLPGLPGIVLGCLAGVAVRRWGPRAVGAPAFLVAAGGLAVEAVAGPPWLVLLGSGVFVAGLAVAVPAVVAVVGDASQDAPGAGMAGYAFLVGLGVCLGPLLADGLAGGDLGVTCGVLAGVLLVPAVALAALSRPRARPA
ncbi:MFS transporter [Nocardioides sp. SYSU D00038]|uniref:MFS transporter n=1 Tax=Nocardioides sp. SYSU D00038 TaxID=2812554 RepID=UPI001967B5D7|nr:MFS transporter [Nocardioides sp. SYSU D00038]